jgi:hypothetical protein
VIVLGGGLEARPDIVTGHGDCTQRVSCTQMVTVPLRRTGYLMGPAGTPVSPKA